MTTITFERFADGNYKGFICKGHAEFAKDGDPDILCAAISALTESTINALEELAHEKLDYEVKDGFLKCDFNCKLQEKSVFLVETLVFSLKQLEKKYGKKYIKVNFKEV